MALLGVLQCGAATASTFTIVAEIGTRHEDAGVLGVLAVDSANNLYAEESVIADGLYELTASSGYSKVRTLQYFGQGNFTVPNGPNGGVTLTSHNVILGTTNAGGTYYDGTVFNLGTARQISLAVLHSFSGAQIKPTDAGFNGTGLTLGLFNRYYGITAYGGINGTPSQPNSGDGALYYVSQDISDPKYKVLWRFGGAGDGINPTYGNLVADKQERLYGMTNLGGAKALGTVFTLQYVNNAWQEQVIYSFQGGTNLELPTANLVLDAKGYLYGCGQGGTHGQGGIFSLTPPAQAGGAWQETVLYNFGDARGDPVAAYPGYVNSIGFGCGITLDPATNLIVGTSYGGGRYNYGTIFTLAPPASGQTAWTETVGYSFRHSTLGGYHPSTAPLQVGKTYYGGTAYGGDIYAFTP